MQTWHYTFGPHAPQTQVLCGFLNRPTAATVEDGLDISKWLAAGKRIHNVAAQFALSETAQAHLAVEKGDKLGTVIVDCGR